jgi:2'-5' RNA ligase
MRLFIAINPSYDEKTRLQSSQDKIKQISAKGNFTRLDNLHLTLVFLGETDISLINSIKQITAEAVALWNGNPFAIIFDHLGRFTNMRGGDIWWLGTQNSLQLNTLQRQISLALEQAGFPIEKRKFKPHLTLARRVRLKTNIPEKAQTPLQKDACAVLAKRVSLMKSESIDGVLTYSEIWSCDL